MLKYEVPVVYEILMQNKPQGPFPAPPIQIIKSVCAASSDPSFQKPKFKRYLDNYQKDGIYCRRPKVLTPERMAYYESVRKKKLKKYINDNRDKIDAMRKIMLRNQ